MILTLFNTLKNNNFVYHREKVIFGYYNFACRSQSIGKNTKYLFDSGKKMNLLKILPHMKKRLGKIPAGQVNESNGSLMRITPLVFVLIKIQTIFKKL